MSCRAEFTFWRRTWKCLSKQIPNDFHCLQSWGKLLPHHLITPRRDRRAKAVAQRFAQHGAATDRFEIGEHTNELPDLDQNKEKKPTADFGRRVEFFGFGS